MTVFNVFPRSGHAFSAAEVGTALGGLFARGPNGVPSPGVLGDPVIAAVAASWRVRVNPFTFVGVTGGAVGLSGVSAAEEVDIAPGAGMLSGQSRIDLICWDVDGALLVVVAGTPAGSPVAPSAGGRVALAEVTVKQSDGMVIAGQVRRVFVATRLYGVAEWRAQVSQRSIPAGGLMSVDLTIPAGIFDPALAVYAQVTGWGSARDTTAHVDNVSATKVTVRLGSVASVARTMGAFVLVSQ